ncbi:hypothetical protein ACZ90_00435 [Streptomyces albus subsp. albus]|nr:hypothetical protein ACZ90_00435 [Streptomyces albus subsp. albus]
MAGTPHHHAYEWLGPGQYLIKPGDAVRRPGHPEFASTAMMPLECADWLRKPARFIKETFTSPTAATEWFRGRVTGHQDLFAELPVPFGGWREVDRRLAAAEDFVGGWYVKGDRFLSLNLIACPNRLRPEYGCPAR